jgi:hypothetical protein
MLHTVYGPSVHATSCVACTVCFGQPSFSPSVISLKIMCFVLERRGEGRQKRVQVAIYAVKSCLGGDGGGDVNSSGWGTS